MNAGRELDALVAEKVMGLDVCKTYSRHGNELLSNWMSDSLSDYGTLYCNHCHKACAKDYSTSIAEAWLVVEKLSEQLQFWLEFYRDDQGPWVAMFFKERDSYGEVNAHSATGETAPLAICLAALKAVGWKENEP